MLTQISELIDLVPVLLALAIPALSAYVGRTSGSRSLTAFAASVLLSVAVAIVDEGVAIDAAFIGYVLQTFLTQLGAYLALWRPLGKSKAVPGTNQHADARA